MAHKISLAAVKAALKNSRTPASLKRGLLKKYGHLISGKLPMSTLATTMRTNPKKRLRKKELKHTILRSKDPGESKRLISQYGKTKELKHFAKHMRLNPAKKKDYSHHAGWSDYADGWDRPFYRRLAQDFIKKNGMSSVTIETHTPYQGHHGLGFFGSKKDLKKIISYLKKEGFRLDHSDIHKTRFGMR